MALHVEDGLNIKSKEGTAVNGIVRMGHAWRARAEAELKAKSRWRAWAIFTTAVLFFHAAFHAFTGSW